MSSSGGPRGRGDESRRRCGPGECRLDVAGWVGVRDVFAVGIRGARGVAGNPRVWAVGKWTTFCFGTASADGGWEEIDEGERERIENGEEGGKIRE